MDNNQISYYNLEQDEVTLKDLDIKNRHIYQIVKRILDIVLSFIGLIISAPIILLTSFFVIAESKGPPILVQGRLGKEGKPFKIYKIRSMYVDAEINTGPKWAEKNDVRVTRVGRVIRKTHIDELPQLVNIFLGEMSFVGPRPERKFFYEKYESELFQFSKRLYVKPGLTGLAQINGGYDIDAEEKLKYDLNYIKNQSLRLDILIIFKTINVVLKGYGAR